MVKEEVWGVSADRARRFFAEQPDVQAEGGTYRYRSCHISLTELEPRDLGVWSAKRILVHFEGGRSDVEAIHHRFLIQFLSAGG